MRKYISNGSILGLTHGVSLFLPILMIPLLINRLSLSTYGVIALVQAFLVYIMIITSYGFEVVMAKKVLQYKGSKKNLSKLFTAVNFLRLILFLVAFVFVYTITFYIEQLENYRVFVALMLLSGISYSFSPVWFCTGVERFKLIGMYSLSAPLATLLLTFYFVNSELDIVLYGFIFLMPNLLFTILFNIYLIKRYSLKFLMPRLSFLRVLFRSGMPIFFSSLSTSFYTAFISIVLGIYHSAEAVGIYSVCEKIVRGLASFSKPIIQVFFSRSVLGIKINTLLIVTFVVLLVGLGSGLYFPSFFISFLMPNVSQEAVLVFQVMLPITVFAFMSNMLGYLYFVASDFSLKYMKILLTVSLISIVLSLSIIPLYGLFGAAIVAMISEFLIFLLFFQKYLSRVRG